MSDQVNNLHIYTASAGSGKTYTIAREYLRLALSKPGNYRHIQAVTFTNKATEEMKARILRELYYISVGQRRDMAKELIEKLNEADWKILSHQEQELHWEMLQARAKDCLRAMLLDYGSFLVSTIDSFFQEILRSFARDLNLQGGFRLELDSKATLDAAVYALLVEQQYKEHSPILRWITNISLSQMRANGKRNLLGQMRGLASELVRDEVKALKPFPSVEEVERLKVYCDEVIDAFISRATEISEEFFRFFRPALDLGCEFKLRHSGVSLFKNWLGRKYPKTFSDLKPDALDDLLDKPQSALKSSGKTKEIKAAWAILDEQDAKAIIDAYNEHVSDYGAAYICALEINKCIASYGLLSAIEEQVRALQRSDNYILLSDAPSLINKILTDEGGVPFLYERIGTRVKHHMIDEFQDTSLMQYQNFVPLLQESLSSGSEASGQDSIIVGDVKQSIYRFRGSDSRQLARLQSGKEGFPIKINQLGVNYRSTRAIVNFNNELYSFLPKVFQDYYDQMMDGEPSEEVKAQIEAEAQIFIANYEGAKQEANKIDEGRVVLHRCRYESDPDESESTEEHKGESQGDTDEALSLWTELPKLLQSLRQRGYRPMDICILVRDKKEAALIAQILQHGSEVLGEPFDFVSDTALALTEAISVAFVISALHYIIKPNDEVQEEELKGLYRQLNYAKEKNSSLDEEELTFLRHLGRKSLYETIESVIAHYREFFELGELPYLIKLLDTALSYQQDFSKDIADFLEMWGERATDLRLALPEDEHKIRLMTIHKSKGLSAPVVILPFLSGDIKPSGKKPIILWCHNPFEEATGLSYVPVKLSSSLVGTPFALDYYRECLKTSLDTLNLLYVATTRAEEEMHIFLPSDTKKNKSGEESISNLSHLLLSQIDRIEPLCTVVPMGEFDSCDLPAKRLSETTKEIGTEPLRLTSIESYELMGRIAELREGLDHFDPERRRNFGNVMHRILSEVVSIDDVPKAKQMAVDSGDLLPEEEALAVQRLDKLLSEPIARPWFDGSGTVLNERSIIGVKTGLLRPDRVVLYPDGSAVVVDYKFGQEQEKYKYQILRYARLLEQMGYKPVRAYLWYLSGSDDALSDEAYVKQVK